MDLNQAEVAVTTQHLIDMGQEKDNLLQMSDFGDMGEFLCMSRYPHRICRNTAIPMMGCSLLPENGRWNWMPPV